MAQPQARKYKPFKQYKIVVVKRPPRFQPKRWNDQPHDAEELYVKAAAVIRPLAAAWARGFNEAEMKDPQGVWAVVKPADPPPDTSHAGTNGHNKRV